MDCIYCGSILIGRQYRTCGRATCLKHGYRNPARWQQIQALPVQTCPWCGDNFKPISLRPRIFCSRVCKTYAALERRHDKILRAGSSVREYFKWRRLLIWEEQRPCSQCGEERTRELIVDHIVPISLGGIDDYANLQVLCHLCHKGKTVVDIFNIYASRSNLDGDVRRPVSFC